EGDEEWSADDEWLIERAKRELEQLGLAKAGQIEAGYVVRQAKAYPIYDDRYRANVDVLRAWLAEHAANVHPVGRNGMFRYNNQDHSMFTAMLTVENIVTGTDHDVWEVNVEEEYHEEGAKASVERPPGAHGTGRDAPVIPRSTLEAARTKTDG
ncbi:MAG TPA: FAD-dependent oxidoreductase, partial [Aquihabitans sp.]|nr:FAD-dependent oxidoreductase [Aquihabitans sp.]